MTEMTERFWRFETGKIGLYLPTLFMLSNIFFRAEKPVMTEMTQSFWFFEIWKMGLNLPTLFLFSYIFFLA